MEIGSKSIPVNNSGNVTFRPVVEEDRQFLLVVYASTRMEELSLTNWGVEQQEAFLNMQLTAQQAHYQTTYPGGEHFIILLDCDPVGRLYIADIEEEVRILDITILPEHRGKGIGTAIVSELMEETAPLHKPLRIFVESFNRSKGLFERLGFLPVVQNGYSVLMAWRQLAAEGAR